MRHPFAAQQVAQVAQIPTVWQLGVEERGRQVGAVQRGSHGDAAPEGALQNRGVAAQGLYEAGGQKLHLWTDFERGGS